MNARSRIGKGLKMERCKDCELAIYCYTDSSSWIFRTKQEMEEKSAAIMECPIREKIEQERSKLRKQAAV